jgi:hypothetical protein
VRGEIIHVQLLDEGVQVWRPVEAELLDDGFYRILGAPEEDETLMFPRGSVVRCEEQAFPGGGKGLVARERIR